MYMGVDWDRRVSYLWLKSFNLPMAMDKLLVTKEKTGTCLFTRRVPGIIVVIASYLNQVNLRSNKYHANWDLGQPKE